MATRRFTQAQITRRRRVVASVGGGAVIALLSGTLIANASVDLYQKLVDDAAAINTVQVYLASVEVADIANTSDLNYFLEQAKLYVSLVNKAKPDNDAYQNALNKLRGDDSNNQLAGMIPATATTPVFSEYQSAAKAYLAAIEKWVAENGELVAKNSNSNQQFLRLRKDAKRVNAAAAKVGTIDGQPTSTAVALAAAIKGLEAAVNDYNFTDWVTSKGDTYSYDEYVAAAMAAVTDALTAYGVAFREYFDAVAIYNSDYDQAVASGWNGNAHPLKPVSYYEGIYNTAKQIVLDQMQKAQKAADANKVIADQIIKQANYFGLYEEAVAAMKSLNDTAINADKNLHSAFNGLDNGTIAAFRTQLQTAVTDLSSNVACPAPTAGAACLSDADVAFLLGTSSGLISHLQEIANEVSALSITPTAAEVSTLFASYQAAATAYNSASGTTLFADATGDGITGLMAPLQALNNEYLQLSQPSISTTGHPTTILHLTQHTLTKWLDLFYNYVGAQNCALATETSGYIHNTDVNWTDFIPLLQNCFSAKSLNVYSASAWGITQAIWGTSYPHYEFNFPTGFSPLKPPDFPPFKAYWEPIELVPDLAHADFAIVKGDLLPLTDLIPAPGPLTVNPVGVKVTASPLAITGVNSRALLWMLLPLLLGATVLAARFARRRLAIR